MGKNMDELAKSMASGVSRREAIAAFVHGLLGLGAVVILPNQGPGDPQLLRRCMRGCRNSGGNTVSCFIDCVTRFRANLTPF